MIVFGNSKAVRSAVFIGFNLIAILSLYFLAIEPLRDLSSMNSDEIVTKRAILERTLKAAAAARRIADLDNAPPSSDLYPAADEGAATAAMVTALKSIAESVATPARSIQTLPVRKIGELAMIGARLEVSGTVASIRNLVFRIETATPALFIVAGATRTPQSISNASEEPTIEARFDVLSALSETRLP